MFGGAEMVYSDLKGDDLKSVRKVLETFSSLVSDCYPKYGLTRGEIPFIKPINFVTVVATNGIHLIVDNVPIGGVPVHTYYDRRNLNIPIPLDALLSEVVREMGYERPIGITLPDKIQEGDDSKANEALQSAADGACAQLANFLRIERLNIPSGYQHLQGFLSDFLQDHPKIEKNVFLMMRFREGEQFAAIETILRKKFSEYGMEVIRADDKDYTGDLWDNVCLHMIGCKYGIAVFEEIDEREFNPSVALELGFMFAQNKRCLLLKDKRMPKMPTDIIGKLYKPFDTYKIEKTIGSAVDLWANDIGL